MSVFIEMHLRVGGDPRGFAEFEAMTDELARLNHPACPDVDWARVEQWCQVLFERNGVDLQTAAAFALARSQLRGLEGMLQGAALIDALSNQWPSLWPALPSARVTILAWLFVQWQPLLRSLALGAQDVPQLVQLDCSLLRLQRQLEGQLPMPLPPLQLLRQQLANLMPRLLHDRLDGEYVPLSIRQPLPTAALPMPIVIWPATPTPPVKRRQPRVGLWLGVAAVTGLMLGWAGSGLTVEGMQRFAIAFEQAPPVPAPVRLDSLLLFAPGSAELRPESTRMLVNALVDIKARPGWLIVIGAHTDNSGDPERNLQLSEARALAVRDWMQRMGDIPGSCFAIQGFGAQQPVASNETEAGRLENRRVDIRLVPETAACAIPSPVPLASIDSTHRPMDR